MTTQPWRSLEELAQTGEFQTFLQREFPRQASEWLPGMDRRRFLQLMGASLALAGLSACSPRPAETIVPQLSTPEQSIPGKPLYYATICSRGGYANGVLVESHEGRPTKIEGNPDHPASLGSADAQTQAAILGLYDPDRSQQILHQGEVSSWQAFVDAVRTQLTELSSRDGAGLGILTETVTSPTLHNQRQALLGTFPQAAWHQYEPVNRDNVYAGMQVAFGQDLEPIYHLDRADVILSLDADFLSALPGSVRYAREFADGRRADRPDDRNANRLYVLESSPTVTGGAGDHRLALSSADIVRFAQALASELGLGGPVPASGRIPAEWVQAVADDLRANPGGGLVVVGDQQPPVVHALAHQINQTLGNVGQTVELIPPVVADPSSQIESLQALTNAMTAGEVEMLLILGGNPVYNTPGDLPFAEALTQVGESIHLGLHVDETAVLCDWHIPAAHFLESWSDGRAFDGTASVQQPLIEPLYGGHSPHELLDLFLSDTPRPDLEIVQAYWAENLGEQDFEKAWRQALHDGIVTGTRFEAIEVRLLPKVGLLDATLTKQPTTDLELTIRPHPAIWDGRFANNSWLQELPDPLTKLTWENAALISPATGQQLDLENGDLVELTAEGGTLQAPIWLLPGQAPGVVTLHLGYGRRAAGAVGNDTGVDVNPLRTIDGLWSVDTVSVGKVGSGHTFASTQHHHSMDGRDLVRTVTASALAENPDHFQQGDVHHEISLYPKAAPDGTAWGMAIDLSACIGCNACVVACQAENNIPVVGKEEVANGREMHWIRLDRYFEGAPADPQIHHQPVTCMHCENAPCEVVCPVAATVHDSEGLNGMIYNRCVGTRYCANNCPYKVRRFNFLDYTDPAESVQLQRNPDVTVRARGVMEKCTFCVQRISAARIDAKLAGRPLAEGDVVTACQATCPTQAIVFGDLNDPNSQVAQGKASPLSYDLLAELGTKPRTSYLAKVRNPNPALSGEMG